MNQKKYSGITSPSLMYKTALIALGIFFLYMSVTTSNQPGDIVINCIALVIMSCFISWGVRTKKAKRGVSPLLVCADDLAYLTQALKDAEGTAWDVMHSLAEDDTALKSEQFKQALNAACDENERLSLKKNSASIQDNSYTICDIEDFLNDELLDDVANTPYSDFVSSALTGLGILGTFVGLVVGLQSFQTGSAEAINASIAPLIDGMKIAFYTSIFGVTFSILYGAFFRNSRTSAQIALQEFLSQFYKTAGSRPQNEAISQLLSYQQSQSDNLNHFVENLSLTLGDAMKDALAPTLSAIPEQFSQQLSSTIMPSLERMEQSFGGLAESISQCQSTGMDTIVNHFIEEMNHCVGDQMSTLGDSIQALCKWQRETVDALDLVINKVCGSSEQLDGINNNLSKTLSTFVDYVTQLDETQKSMTQRCEDMMKQAAESLALFDNLRTQTESSLEHSVAVVNSTSEICTSIQAQQELMQTMFATQREQLQKDAETAKIQLDELKVTCSTMMLEQKQFIGEANSNLQEQTIRFADLCDQATQNMDTATSKLAQSAERLHNDLDSSLESSFAQFDKHLARSIEHFSGTLTQLKETTEDLASMVESTPKMVDETTTATQNQVKLHLQETSKAQEDFIRIITAALQSMESDLMQLKKNAGR